MHAESIEQVQLVALWLHSLLPDLSCTESSRYEMEIQDCTF